MIPVEYLAPSALIGLAVLFIFTGVLVPKRFYQEKVDECDRWRLAYELHRERAVARMPLKRLVVRMWFRDRGDPEAAEEALKEAEQKLEETESRSGMVTEISTALRILREKNGLVEKLDGLWEDVRNVQHR